MLRLVITKKGDPFQEERTFSDSPEERADLVTIGRAETNDVVLDDPEGMISRHHAVLVRLPGPAGEYFIRDLSSRNSTWVEGQAVCTKRLRHGEVITLGGYSLACWFQEEEPAEHRGREGDLPIVIGEGKSSKKPGPKGQAALPTRLSSDHQRAEGQTGTDRREETIEELLRKAQMVSAVDDLFREFIGPILHGVEADRGFIALFDPDTDACHCVARQLATSERIRVADGDYLGTLRQGMRIAEGRVLLVPFRREGEVAGFFCVNRKPSKPFFSLEDGDFLENLGSQLITHLLERARRRAAGESGVGEIVDEGLEWPLEMVGHSAAMKGVWRQLQEAFEHEVPVLITGETGTGKELVATAIHRRSSRSQGPLVAINCAAIPESLLESELFGHEKGAFTDARDQHRGLFEQADQGTLFLDEVGEMAPAAQVRLLRVLEEHKITRIGGSMSIAIDVRIVAATNKDLQEAVAQGTFRRDLYHRLKVLELNLPPLRQRREDVPLLAHYFIDQFAKRREKKTRWISRLAMQQLLNHHWPGNVRELRNLLASAVSGEREVLFSWDLFADQEQVPSQETASEERAGTVAAPPAGKVGPRRMAEVEEEKVREALEWTKGNKSQAARALGWSWQTLDAKMKKYGIV